MPRIATRLAVAALAVAIGACSADQSPTGITASLGSAVAESQLQVAPTSLALAVGERGRVVATPSDGSGRVVATKSVRWSSEDASIASVDAEGFVTGVSAGATAIVGRRGVHEVRVSVVVAGIGPDGGSVTGGEGAVTVSFPAGALSAPTAVSIAAAEDPLNDPRVVPGTVWSVSLGDAEVAADGTIELTADASVVPSWLPASSMRLARLVDGQWELLETELVEEPAPAAAQSASLFRMSSLGLGSYFRWRGSFFSFGGFYSGIFAIVNPCTPIGLASSVSGTISANDCLFTVAERRSDYYSVTIPNGTAYEFTTTSDFAGLWGVKEATADPNVGLVFGSRALGQAMRVVGNGAPLQLFLSGQDGSSFGSYTITRSEAEPFTCGRVHVIVPGAAFDADLNDGNACATTIQFSPFPDVIGRPLLYHGYNVRLLKDVSYTFRLSGLSPTVGMGFTIFLGGQVLRQSVGDFATTREFTFQLPAAITTPSAYVFAEVSTGRFFNGVWETRPDAYRLEIIRNP